VGIALAVFGSPPEIAESNTLSLGRSPFPWADTDPIQYSAAVFRGNPYTKLECGPMPNVMVALPNIGGALCSTLQSLADAHY